MKKTALIFLSLMFISLTSCRIPREVLWDYVVMPFSGNNKDQVHNIDKLMADCDTYQYEFDLIYSDSLRQNKNYMVPSPDSGYKGYSPIQVRMYDSTGRYAGSYEICNGNAKYIKIYESVPIHSPLVRDSLLNRNLSFQKDVHFLVTDDAEKEKLLSSIGDFDYTIIVFWPSYYRYYTKRNLRQIKKYVSRFDENYSFRVIYVHHPRLGKINEK